MDHELRRKIFTATTLLVLTISFTALYILLSANVQKFAFNRIKDISIHAASIISGIFDRYAYNAEVISSLTTSAQDEDHLVALLQQSGTSRIGQYSALRLSAERIFLLDHGNIVQLREDPTLFRIWRANLPMGESGTRILGPVSPPAQTGKEILVVTPLKDGRGIPRGAFALRMPLSLLTEMISGMNFPGDVARTLYVISGSGEILSPVGPDNADAAAQTLPPPMREALKEASGTVTQIRLADQDFSICKAPIPGTDWHAVLLSHTEYEMRFLSALRVALITAWACLVFFIVLLFHQARRFRHYKALSESDHLTGVGNRLAFEKALARLQDSEHYPISLIMLDVDGLKVINDTLGHEAGDALLRRVAALLQRSLRENDAIYRIGGDEFAVILPSANRALAQALADRIMSNVLASHKVKSLSPLSISYGLAEAGTQNDFDTLYCKADEAMYAHKNTRRETARQTLEEWLLGNTARPADRRHA